MLATVIDACPSADEDFEPLSEYQAQTPETFFDGKPILFYHDANIKAWIARGQYARLPALFSGITQASPPEAYALEGEGQDTSEEERIEVFVASDKLTIFSHSRGSGYQIPYPAITLHAVKNFHHLHMPEDQSFKFVGVYMQLEFASPGGDDDGDEPEDPIELTLVPYKGLPKEHPTPDDRTIDPLNTERTNALFNQISACSNLNPDPGHEEDEEDDGDGDHIIFEGDVPQPGTAVEGLPDVLRGDGAGGLPPPMPGSSGWITAENVHEYFDEEGNWIGQDGVSGELGDGAGRVRGRDEVEQQDGTNGHTDAEDGEAKRTRTE
ncbi:regulator of volume decrease after cellular swelling-domain-containing protein [Xylariaceae sp. FL0804]|nr:regulator of volume decrease after cellular swelling-domain-containing protein [Xylariaceae sp. FL0804]